MHIVAYIKCIFRCLLADGFHFIGTHRDAFAEELCTGFGNEVVLFVAEAGEAAPCIELVVADEIGEAVFRLPVVNQFGDEVDARFDGEDKARFEWSGQAQ